MEEEHPQVFPQVVVNDFGPLELVKETTPIALLTAHDTDCNI